MLHQDQWGPQRGAVLTKWGGQGCHLGKTLQTPRGLSNASCPARGSRAHYRGAGLSPRGPKKLREEEFSAEAPALMRRGRVIPANSAIGQERATGLLWASRLACRPCHLAVTGDTHAVLPKSRAAEAGFPVTGFLPLEPAGHRSETVQGPRVMPCPETLAAACLGPGTWPAFTRAISSKSPDSLEKGKPSEARGKGASGPEKQGRCLGLGFLSSDSTGSPW